MRQTWTIMRKHGSEKWEVLIGPAAPYVDHRRFMKKLRLAKKDPVIAEVATVYAMRRLKVDPNTRFNAYPKQLKRANPVVNDQGGEWQEGWSDPDVKVDDTVKKKPGRKRGKTGSRLQKLISK